VPLGDGLILTSAQLQYDRILRVDEAPRKACDSRVQLGHDRLTSVLPESNVLADVRIHAALPLVRLHRLLSSGAVDGVAANWIDHGSAGRTRPCCLGCRDWFLGAMDSEAADSNLIDSIRRVGPVPNLPVS